MAVTDQVIINNFASNIDDSIKAVGGDTSSVQNLCDYPKIIREQLVASNVDVNFTDGDGIVITKDGTNYIISATSGALTTGALTSGEYVIPKSTSIQKVFETMFADILPSLPSVVGGDISFTDDSGKNQYQHPNGDPDIIRIKKGLKPNTNYLRLYIVSQEEPIYISLADLNTGITDAPKDGNLYGRQNNQWVEIPSSIADVSKLKEDVSNLKTNTTKLDARVSTNETNISNLSDRVTSISDNAAATQSSVSCINTSITNINKKIDDLVKKDEALTESIDITDKKLENTTKVVADNKKNITSLQETDEAFSQDIETIKNAIRNLQNGGMCVTTSPLSPPYPVDLDIPTGTKFQEVFEQLFDIVLPAMPSVLKGDIITSSERGKDMYQHPRSQKTRVKSGLGSYKQYIRLFIASQEEPIYISLDPLKVEGGGGISANDILSVGDAGKLFDDIFNK